MSKSKLRIWDAPVRVLHWLLAISIAAAWTVSGSTGPWHEYWGYAACAVIALRLAWGVIGSPYARFTQFVRGIRPTLGYARQVLSGTAPRYLGHNPLGGWMVLTLLSSVALLGVSGWLLNTELLWGYAWPVRIHSALGWLLIVLIALHVAGVLLASWQHRENLIAAMLSGDKDAPQ